MKCFLQEQVDNDKFPLLSNRVWYFKNDEGGIDAMCKIVEDYANEKSLAGIKNLFKNGCSLEIVVNSFPNIPKEIICEIYDKATKKTSA